MAEMMMKRKGKEAGPAPKSSPGFESERIPNPGDFLSSVSNKVLFFCKAIVLSSNTSLHDSASRFRPALSLPGRSGDESAAFGASRLSPGSALVHLIEPVQWVNQPMVHLVNHQLVLTSQRRSTTDQRRSTVVNGDQSFLSFLAPPRHKMSNDYTRIS
ncbi:hypothetical protein PIB30_058113 [Stylosanthes scabra]|uniref:Uncharacterized protein n=1 Tax=Stylosanthes scabra TaxID=79078 RepID=A0ABU6QKK4_9FABA|nr:hypothetical protein [Stylosanthes scabra]